MMMDKNITVVLSSWRRPLFLQEQIERFTSQSVPPAEIWVWADRSEENASFDFNSISADRIFRNTTNLGVYGRFAVALLARTRYIAIFDDDMMPAPGYLENCLETIHRHAGIIAAAGIRFLSSDYRDCIKFGWLKRTPTVAEVDVGCNGWFFEGSWLNYLWREPPFNWANGEDMRFAFLAQKYGQLKTFTPPQDDDLRIAAVRTLGLDQVALHAYAEHYVIRQQQLNEQLRQGWKTVNGVMI